jgi:hypothetical protein
MKTFSEICYEYDKLGVRMFTTLTESGTWKPEVRRKKTSAEIDPKFAPGSDWRTVRHSTIQTYQSREEAEAMCLKLAEEAFEILKNQK